MFEISEEEKNFSSEASFDQYFLTAGLSPWVPFTLTHVCLKVHCGVTIVLYIFVDPI